MKKMLAVLAFCALIGFSIPDLLGAQTTPDTALVTAIAAIKAVDNHAHPLRALKEGERDAEWEEFSCLGTRSARQALALALTEMMRDNQIPYEEALSIARKVLRENAIKRYKLETS